MSDAPQLSVYEVGGALLASGTYELALLPATSDVYSDRVRLDDAGDDLADGPRLHAVVSWEVADPASTNSLANLPLMFQAGPLSILHQRYGTCAVRHCSGVACYVPGTLTRGACAQSRTHPGTAARPLSSSAHSSPAAWSNGSSSRKRPRTNGACPYKALAGPGSGPGRTRFRFWQDPVKGSQISPPLWSGPGVRLINAMHISSPGPECASSPHLSRVPSRD